MQERERTGVMFGAVSKMVDHIVDRRIQEHERRLHLVPARRSDAVQAVPFADVSIPDSVLARIAEDLASGEELDMVAIAERHGYPWLLIERELVDYIPRYRRWLLRRMIA
jgi:hypothetical protein